MKKIFIQNLIIGFGKGGKTLSADLAKNGQSVILLEKDENMYGGTCINLGCIPSKKLIFEGKNSENFDQAMKKKNTLITALRKGNFEKFNSIDGVQILTAEAKFIDENRVIATGKDEEFEITAERIFINTGTRPATLNAEGVDSKHIFSSNEMLSLSYLPKKMIIVGAGFIALEFAFMYRKFGSEVTILNLREEFLSREDDDVRKEIENIMIEKGIILKNNVTIQRFEEGENMTKIITENEILESDAILIALGRVPNTDSLDVRKAKVDTDDKGYIVTNNTLQTTNSKIYAMGDVAGSPQFTYISLDDYRIVRDNILGSKKRSKQDRKFFPTAVFIDPPLSHIGMNEKMARKNNKDFIIYKLPANSIPKAKIIDETHGFIKILVENDTHMILGATIFCSESHEIINLFKMAMDNNISADYLKNQIFTHPTISEAINDVLSSL